MMFKKKILLNQLINIKHFKIFLLEILRKEQFNKIILDTQFLLIQKL